jgi:predicted acylesterase/phospholipase RssA
MGTDDGFWGAVSTLRNSGVFRNTSARLLADLVELAAPDLQRIAFGRQREVEAFFVVVLEGAVRQVKSARRERANTPKRSDLARQAIPPEVLPGGDILWSAGDLICYADTGPLCLEGKGPLGGLVLPLTTNVLTQALHGSPELARSLNEDALPRAQDLLDLVHESQQRGELILLCQAPGVGAPMEALAHLLASSVEQLFVPPTTKPVNPQKAQGRVWSGLVVTGSGIAQLKKWENGSFVEHGAWDQYTWEWLGSRRPNFRSQSNSAAQPRNSPPTEKKIWSELELRAKAFGRLFFVRDRAPNVLPNGLRNLKFHRIVYVTRDLPPSIPEYLAAYLVHDVQNCADESNPYFSSFIPTIILDGTLRPARSRNPSVISLISPILSDVFGLKQPSGHFRTEPIDSDAVLTLSGPALSPRSRLKRDLCRVAFDPATLQDLWRQADNGYKPFIPLVSAARPAYVATAQRWARAVTNRQVGLALSGGGASSFRGVPLLRFLHDRKVPVDVVGSSSGGSLLAAYYCRDGLDGLKRYVRGASQSGWSGLVAQISSQIIETALDWIFRDTRVEELEVRFVPLTMALADGAPPEARAVVNGTLGEAVRVSGSLPLFFARTKKRGTVYSDGSLITPLPVRALPYYGADLVFAFSSIPGPAEANPLVDWPGADLFYMLPFTARFVDMWVANAFFLQDVTQAVASDAAVFIQASSSDASMIEIMRFDQAERIVRKSETDRRVQMGAEACAQRWSNFSSKQ